MPNTLTHSRLLQKFSGKDYITISKFFLQGESVVEGLKRWSLDPRIVAISVGKHGFLDMENSDFPDATISSNKIVDSENEFIMQMDDFMKQKFNEFPHTLRLQNNFIQTSKYYIWLFIRIKIFFFIFFEIKF